MTQFLGSHLQFFFPQIRFSERAFTVSIFPGDLIPGDCSISSTATVLRGPTTIVPDNMFSGGLSTISFSSNDASLEVFSVFPSDDIIPRGRTITLRIPELFHKTAVHVLWSFQDKGNPGRVGENREVSSA